MDHEKFCCLSGTFSVIEFVGARGRHRISLLAGCQEGSLFLPACTLGLAALECIQTNWLKGTRFVRGDASSWKAKSPRPKHLRSLGGRTLNPTVNSSNFDNVHVDLLSWGSPSFWDSCALPEWKQRCRSVVVMLQRLNWMRKKNIYCMVFFKSMELFVSSNPFDKLCTIDVFVHLKHPFFQGRWGCYAFFHLYEWPQEGRISVWTWQKFVRIRVKFW